MKYFDPTKKQLIHIEKKPTPDFWDSTWGSDKNIRDEIIGIKNTFVSRITKRYLKPDDGIILEGGCGRGGEVASLVNNGYKVIGVDYAKRTVEMLNKYIPELDIRLADVRKLPFGNNYFAGYWSLGVIEHFWEGYETIALEMSRVIRNHGYLFLSFPYMSLLRRVKAGLGLYDLWQTAMPHDDFYHYALNARVVIEDFQRLGFRLVRTLPWGGIKGTKDEIPAVRPVLQKLFDYKGGNILIRLVRRGISAVMSPMAAHSVLLVMRKEVQ